MNSQIQFETNGLRVLVWAQPSWAVNVEVKDKGRTVSFGFENGISRDYTELPEGNWKFHAFTTEMTEEQAKIIANVLWSGYRDHDTIDDGTVGNYNRFMCDTAKHGALSLLRSNGINPNEKHVILIELK